MIPRDILRMVLICFSFLGPGALAPVVAGYPIAGVIPHQRPEGAPRIQQVLKDSGWYGRALTGVSRPYPYSLRFLEDQGNWNIPFDRPGMTGRYDIRGWHR